MNDSIEEDLPNIRALTSIKCDITNDVNITKHYIVVLCQEINNNGLMIMINLITKNKIHCLKRIHIDPQIKIYKGIFDVCGQHDLSQNNEQIFLHIGYGEMLITLDLMKYTDQSVITLDHLITKAIHPQKDSENYLRQNWKIISLKSLDASNIAMIYKNYSSHKDDGIANYQLALFNTKHNIMIYNFPFHIQNDEFFTKLYGTGDVLFVATTKGVFVLNNIHTKSSQSLKKLIGITKYHGVQYKNKPSGKTVSKHLTNKIKLNGYIPALNKNASKYMMMEASDELFRNTINFLDPNYDLKQFGRDMSEILCHIKDEDIEEFRLSFKKFEAAIKPIDPLVSSTNPCPEYVCEYAANCCTLFKCLVQKLLTWETMWARQEISFLIQRSCIPACFYELLIEKILHQNDFQTLDLAYANLSGALNEKCIVKCLIHILDHPQEIPDTLALSIMRYLIRYRGNSLQMAKILKYLTLEHSYRLLEYLLSLFTTTVILKPQDKTSLVSQNQSQTSNQSSSPPSNQQPTDSIGNILHWLIYILEAFYNQIICEYTKSVPLIRDLLSRVHTVLDIVEMIHPLKLHVSRILEKIQISQHGRPSDDVTKRKFDDLNYSTGSSYCIEVLYL